MWQESTDSAREIIRQLDLIPHPEGGFYRETFASHLLIRHPAITDETHVERPAMTQIYFLLEAGDFSSFHRVRSDETWHLYGGGPLELHFITQQGDYERRVLGLDLLAGEEPQITIRANSWQGARPALGARFALCGCTVAPGFDFADFSLGGRHELVVMFPGHGKIIRELTRDP
jgi:predicted cupin superfamily sugar epimerase